MILAALDAMLESSRSQFERVLIAVEGLYSMDGDSPNLPELIAIKRKYGAWLLVDDAHGLGVLGSNGLGVFEHFQCDPKDVDIWMGTLSKTLAACGGYIVGQAALVDYLKCISGGFVYSVGMSPPLAAAAAAALDLLHREPERVAMLRDNSKFFLKTAEAAGLNTGTSEGFAIIPVILGNSLLAVLLSQKLFERGINVQPIIHPAVPERAARLRFFLNATHTKAQIADTVHAVAEELQLIKQGSALSIDAALLQSFKL
jgi:7-keto-8-aminopelargonate synthetase-like enzyme